MTQTDVSSEPNGFLDTPITHPSDDLLRFDQLSNTMAKTILAQPNTKALTLGIDGPWGSGKSSLIHLLHHDITTLDTSRSIHSLGTIIVSFSPWLITNHTALIAGFFSQLDNAIADASSNIRLLPALRSYKTLRRWFSINRWRFSRQLRASRRAMAKFATLASLASTTASVTDPSLVSAATSSIFDRVGRMISPKYLSLEDQKERIVDCLYSIASNDSTFRIIVTIDDIDRLDPADALEVLRLIKSVANFPTICYLLAYDQETLSSAIVKSNLVDHGDIYLEKIIQFSFKIPPLEPFQLRGWLRNELEKHFHNHITNNSLLSSIVLDEWAGRLLSTPRDIKRLLFAVNVIWSQMDDEINLLDLIWILMVKEKASNSGKDLYSWVVSYLQSLDALAIGGRVTGTMQDQRKLISILEALGWRKYLQSDGSNSMDFHHLGRILAGIKRDYLDELTDGTTSWTHKVSMDDLHEFRHGRRLSSPWHWRIYFALNPPSHALTDPEWGALERMALISAEELEKGLRRLIDVGHSSSRHVGDQVIARVSYEAKREMLPCPETWLEAIISSSDVLRRVSRRDHLFQLGKTCNWPGGGLTVESKNESTCGCVVPHHLTR